MAAVRLRRSPPTFLPLATASVGSAFFFSPRVNVLTVAGSSGFTPKSFLKSAWIPAASASSSVKRACICLRGGGQFVEVLLRIAIVREYIRCGCCCHRSWLLYILSWREWRDSHKRGYGVELQFQFHIVLFLLFGGSNEGFRFISG